MPGSLPDQVDPFVQQALQDRPELKDLRLEQSAAERFAKAEHALIYPTVSIAGTAGIVPAGESAVPRPIWCDRCERQHSNLQWRAVSRPADRSGVTRQGGDPAGKRPCQSHHARCSRGISERPDRLRTSGPDRPVAAAGPAGAGSGARALRLGLSSIIELSQAQLNLTSAQIANTSAKYDYQAQRSVVDYEVGALR